MNYFSTALFRLDLSDSAVRIWRCSSLTWPAISLCQSFCGVFFEGGVGDVFLSPVFLCSSNMGGVLKIYAADVLSDRFI